MYDKAKFGPKRTAMAWVKLLPVSVTGVPPPGAQAAGFTELITGGDATAVEGPVSVPVA
ncbi:hypothetical protein GCM10009578_047490 [Streptomyces rhizosphaericus]